MRVGGVRMDLYHQKEFFSKKLCEPQFDVLNARDKDFVRNVSLAESSGETNELIWELNFLKALLECITRKVNGK